MVGDGSEPSTSAGPRPGFFPPQVAARYVPRPRLLRLLDEAASAPLTLVVAPAGTGKTVLVARWAAEAGRPIAWLTLDGQDRDAARLEARIAAAVATLVRGVSGVPDEVAGEPVLVIDEAHVVDVNAAATDVLARFIQDPPARVHVVVASRREPAIPLDRLRVRGQVGEIRFAELRFTGEEACELLARLDDSLVGEQATAVAEQAGGWVAALELAAIAARSARGGGEPFPLELDGRLVRDYVMHEVLADESPEMRDALAAAAVVAEVGPSLAKALTGRPDASHLLRRAEARGLFVMRLPGRSRFAVHSPVRAALLYEQAAEHPDHLADRHARAARWYESEGETVLALDHWLLAGRHRDALALLASQHATLYDRGLETVVAETIAHIPVAVANLDVVTMMEHAWCHLLVDRDRFAELVDKVVWWARRSPPPAHLRHRITMLRSIAATAGGRWVEGGALAQDAVAAMGEGWWSDPLGRFGCNMVARALALSERWSGADGEVHEAELALSRDPERRLSFEGIRALGEALSGRPVDALRVVASVRDVAAAADMTILDYELALAEALSRLELGDRSTAVPMLYRLATEPAGTMLFCRVLAAVRLVEARLDDGDVTAARDDLNRVEALVAAESFGADGRSWVARVGTRVALAEGAFGEARAFAARVDDSFWGPVSGARVDLAAGCRADAAAALRVAVPRCDRHQVVRALLQARAVDDRDEAIRLVTAAVELAVRLNMLQTVAAEGTEVVQLVERAAWRVPEEWMGRLRRAAAATGVVLASEAPNAEPLVDSLTSRERDVLRLLAGRLTVREIASELSVSPNTLKFHLKTIYRKLGVGSRAEAAEVARRVTRVLPGERSTTPPSPSPSGARTRRE